MIIKTDAELESKLCLKSNISEAYSYQSYVMQPKMREITIIFFENMLLNPRTIGGVL